MARPGPAFGAAVLACAGVLLADAAPAVGRSRATPPPQSQVAGHVDADRARLDELARGLSGTTGAAALVDVLEIGRLFGSVPPAHLVHALRTPAAAWLARPASAWSPAGRVLRAWLVEAARRAGDTAAIGAFDDPTGSVRTWAWLGPFGDEHGSALDRSGAVEAEVAVVGNPMRAAWPGREGQVVWRTLQPERILPGGRVQLDELVDRPDDALLYAQVWLAAVRPGAHLLRVGTDSAARLWLDGRLVAALPVLQARNGMARSVPDLPEVHEIPVDLSAGWHRLLIKLSPTAGRIRLAARAFGRDGLPAPIRARAEHLPDAPARVALPDTATPAAARAVEDACAGLHWPDRARPSPATLAGLVALAWHGWPLPAPLLARVVVADPRGLPRDARAALAHAMLPDESGDRLDRLRTWSDRLPDAIGLHLAEANVLDELGKAPEAHRLWSVWHRPSHPPLEEQSARACALRAALWARLGADRLATRALDRCVARWPLAPDLFDAAVRNRQARDRLAEVDELQRSLVEQEPGVVARHDAVLQTALDRGDLDRAAGLAAAEATLFGVRARPFRTLAFGLLADDQPAAAAAALARDASAVDAPARTLDLDLRARLALARGQTADALAWLDAAIALAPARADLRARRQLLKPGDDFFAPLRRDLAGLARREAKAARRHPLEVRLRQTVLRVVGNGQQARYDAEVIAIGKDGPPVHALEIEYAPSLSHCDVLQAVVIRADGRTDRSTAQETDRLGDDAGGMYFDLERITLRFKNLRPGDTVVAEWVVRDNGPTPFGLVFGELLPLGDENPVKEVDAVVQVPTGTALHWSVGDARGALPAGLSMVQRAGDGAGWDEWRLRAYDLAGIEAEERMPAGTDVLPYLHVSSFASWAAAATWYEGLMAAALPVRGQDPLVRDLAARLVHGADSLEQKVRSVYAYAAQQVRYVGLEFGIHSLKPHAVREVIQRRFGDCKDKATLIVALLGEVGIDAQVVLVRSVDQGRLHDEVASLGVFNHAIAHVPALGWYLDATAQHHGPLELPDADAGATALHIPVPAATGVADDAAVREAATAPVRLPVPGAAHNLVDERLDGALQADGTLHLTVVQRLRGSPAAEARARFVAAEKRLERVEQHWATRFPGLKAERVSVRGLDPPQDDVEIEFTATVPGWAIMRPDGLAVAPLRPPEAYVQSLANREVRSHDIVLARAFREYTRLRLLPPAGHVWARTPGDAEVAFEHGHFQLDVDEEERALLVESTLELRERQLPVGGYRDLRVWLAAVDGALRSEAVACPEAP
ncbi:MAG: DUF3857 domain-containing protein [Myxococcales bacterium]|nr:DUF3857 domain-containing protein [Myxococcales bacterium]